MTYLASAAKMCGRRVFFFEWGGTKIGDPQIGVVWTFRGKHPNPVVYQVYHPSIFNRQLKKVPRGIPPFLGKPKWVPVVHHGSPIIIGHIAYSWGIEILEMGQYQTTQIGSMKFPTYYSVHFWTVNYRSLRGVEWPQKPDRILHLKLYTVQVVLCSLRLCYVWEQRCTILVWVCFVSVRSLTPLLKLFGATLQRCRVLK